MTDTQTENNLLAAALAYAERGWPVFPLEARGKKPLTKRGFKDATTDAAQIRNWWASWPEANIGLPTGHAFDVLDIDGPEGEEALRALLGEAKLPPAPAASTGKGLHVYFAPTGRGNTAGKLGPKLDTRGAGGYVVAPPSVHPSGAVYEWVRTPNGLPLPAWPEKLSTPEAKPAKAVPVSSVRRVSRTTAYGRAALDGILRDVAAAAEGSRNHTLNRAAFRAGQLVAGEQIEEAEALATLAEGGRRCGLPDAEAQKTIDSGFRAGLSEPAGPAPSASGTAGPASGSAPQLSLPGARPLTDLGNAERLVDHFGVSLRWCAALGWLIWDGRRWAPDDRLMVEEKARMTVRRIYGEAEGEPDDKRRMELARHAKASESRRSISAMVDLSRHLLAIRVSDLDSDPWLLNVANGILDLRTGELRPHESAALLTKLVPVSYDADAQAPTWDRFLARVVPSEANREYLQHFIGYSLTGTTRDHILPLLYGCGRNGKSTFIEAIRGVLGDYSFQAPQSLLMAQRYGTPGSDRADLAGRRLAVCTETEEGAALAEATVKSLTGGDEINARRLYHDAFNFSPTHKLLMATNHKPRVRGTDHAIWSRLKLIDFEVQISEEERDPQLGEKLRREAAGILAWAVRGCFAWQERGKLVDTPEIIAATAGYRADEDIVAQFISDGFDLFPDGHSHRDFFRIGAGELYGAFKNYCETQGLPRPMTQHLFGSRLTSLGIEKTRNRSRGVIEYVGIKARQSAPEGAPR